ncbi:unnamed protein product [Blepharisma stoltei]|uniref:Uncharacterized protein n=1 Tax=Blepharisma stoltei TaxID=1481888 RepID=A0AAU9JG85_9CILI|nr:unnamed protein product [Blepharisma stoltei]
MNKINPGRKILDIRIDMGNQSYSHIRVHENDEPDDLAYKFCLENELNIDECQSLISKAIEHQIDILLDEEERSNKLLNTSKLTSAQTYKNELNLASHHKFQNYFNNLRQKQENCSIKGRYELSSERSQKSIEEQVKHSIRHSSLTKFNNTYAPSFKLNKTQMIRPASNSRERNEKIIGKNSEKIFIRMKKDRYVKLFRLLNPGNHSSLLFLSKIDFELLTSQLINILKPLWANLEENEGGIDYEMFSIFMDDILIYLTPGDKSLLFSQIEKLAKNRDSSSFSANAMKKKFELI